MTRRPAAEKIQEPSGINAEGGLSISYRPLRELVPYARNARTHSTEQIAKIRASLRRFGWTNPILIADDGVIAGHARLTTALQMAEEGDAVARQVNPWEAPTIDLSHLSAEDRRAYVLADNRIALDAGWDQEILRSELADLSSVEGLDIAITGFDLKEIGEIMLPPGPPAEKEERLLTKAENDLLDVAWRRALEEWAGIVDTADDRPWLTTTFTKGVLAVQYLRALILGEEIPRGATLAYTPHRIFIEAGSQSAISEVFAAATKLDARSLRDSVRWTAGEKPSLDKLLGATSLPIHQFRLANEFPAHLARDLMDEFSPNMGARILDPCHGWGGRALGFLLSERASYYHGIDASFETSVGVAAMYKDLASLTPERGKVATFDCCPFEDAEIEASGYDFALTSPPYYDTEKYFGDTSSWKRYSSFDLWLTGFYCPMIQKVARALMPRGIFALQVGSQAYPLTEKAIEFAPKVGLRHVETRHTSMVNNHKGTDPDQGEVVIILAKA